MLNMKLMYVKSFHSLTEFDTKSILRHFTYSEEHQVIMKYWVITIIKEEMFLKISSYSGSLR